jgi:trimeric autotransporter adhesin
MVNQEICTKMNRSSLIETENNFRCSFAGPGDSGIKGNSFYDIGHDMIVDLAEASCPYTRSGCTANGCIGLGTPASAMAVAGFYFYDRSSGSCHYSPTNGTWRALDQDSLVPSTDITVNDMNRTLEPLNPPLVNIRAERANLFCDRRSFDNDIDGISANPQPRLPFRKEQIAYSAHPVGVSSLQNDQTERGLSLNSSSKCNSSAASGLEFAYTNTQVPATSFNYSIPGTETSDIRSIHTGSIPIGQSTSTQACVSRYGLQDVYGNVSEWVSDRFSCEDDNTCQAVESLEPGVNQMQSLGDPDIFGNYAMDGVKGPCRDLNADGLCDASDAPLTDWKIQDKSFDASFFSLPLGLPIHRLYPINNPVFVSPVTGSVLEIGPTSGITLSALHNDAIYVNAEQLMAVPITKRGNMATGGGYLDGDTAGRWHFELVPEADISSAFAFATLNSPAPGTGSIIFEAEQNGATGNDITVRLIDGATAGDEIVSVSGLSITVFIEDGLSEALDIANKINDHPVAGALVEATVLSASNARFNVTEGVRLSGGRDQASSSRADIGYRCTAPILYNTYDEPLPTD